MTFTNSGNKYKFAAIQERHNSGRNIVYLRQILKSGKPGAAREYRMYGGEKTAQDVIDRLEKLNPGTRWIAENGENMQVTVTEAVEIKAAVTVTESADAQEVETESDEPATTEASVEEPQVTTFATVEEAWKAANKIFPTDYELDAESSERAGYPIYRSTAEGHWYDHISDLNARLEVNIGNKSINLWIEAKAAQKEKPEETPEAPEEGYVRIEATARKSGETRKYRNYDAFLKDYRFFCGSDSESAEPEFEAVIQTMQRLQTTGATFNVTRGDLDIRFTYYTYKDGGEKLCQQSQAATRLGQKASCLYTRERLTQYNLVVDGSRWNPDETERTVYDALKEGENVGMEMMTSYLDANGIKWGRVSDLRLTWVSHGTDRGTGEDNGGHYIVSALVEE